jgi:putative SOS response-associated peptidase YedK
MQAQGAKKKFLFAGLKTRFQTDLDERRDRFPLQTLAFGRVHPSTGEREAVDGQFGLVPDWVGPDRGGAKFGRNCYNARTETVFGKPSFRKAILARRAVVPVDCFYEFPDKESPLRHRFKVKARNGEGFWLAAIWERNEALNLESVAVLTTGPMGLLEPFHSRSPLILDDAQLDGWLDPKLKDASAIAEAFAVHGSEPFELEREAWGKRDGAGKPDAQGDLPF